MGKTFSVETEIDGARLRAEIFLGGKLMAIREAHLDPAGLDPVTLRAELLQYHQEVIASITDRAEKCVLQKMSDCQSEASESGSVLQFPDRSESTKSQADGAGLPAEVLENAALSLAILGSIDGFLGACIVDASRGVALSQQGGGALDLETAAAGIAVLVQEERDLLASLGLEDPIEDVLISLGKQYHLVRPLTASGATFIYLILDRSESNLARARRELESFETGMSQSVREAQASESAEGSVREFRREFSDPKSVGEEPLGEAFG